MNISFVTANLGSGGAERVISILANEFDKHGHRVEIVFFKDRHVFYPVNNGIRKVVASEECKSSAMWKRLMWFRHYIKRTKPDVVIPFRVSVYTTTLFSLLGVSVPIISSERIDPHIPDPFWNTLRVLLLPFTTHLVVQTSYIKSFYPRFIQKKTTIILNPVRELGLPTEIACKENRIISVARLDPQKNQEMMIRAFAQIADKYPDWKLVIYGEGPLRAQLEALVSSFMLQERVLLPGRTEHVIEELRKSKVFCFSSNYEGLSNSIIEAICVGLPVVTTKVSGTEDIIVDGENGYVIPINDDHAMVNALSMLLGDEHLIEHMGENNRKKAFMFSIEDIYIQWENLINKVVQNEN